MKISFSQRYLRARESQAQKETTEQCTWKKRVEDRVTHTPVIPRLGGFRRPLWILQHLTREPCGWRRGQNW